MRSVIENIPSVNFHLWEPCNMKCKFCFATFQDVKRDVLPKGHMGEKDSLRLVQLLAESGLSKINFAGGEPTLCPWLPALIKRAKEGGLTTSIVTNGAKITPEWLDRLDGNLDWVTLSIDTVDPEKLQRLGRATKTGPLLEDDYLKIINDLTQRNIRLKINTVVTSENWEEDFTAFIKQANPQRWKILQALPVAGQNDWRIDDFIVTSPQFDAYVARNKSVEKAGIEVVPESNVLMTGSYLMIDPAGRFFDNVAGKHTYSRHILAVGVVQALTDVSVIPERFAERGGRYDW